MTRSLAGREVAPIDAMPALPRSRPRSRHWSRRGLGVTIALVLMIVNVALNLESDRRAAASGDAIAQSRQVLEALGALRRGAQRAQAAAFGYIVSGEGEYLAGYRAAAARLGSATDAAEKLGTVDSAMRRRFGELHLRLAAEVESLDAFAGARETIGLPDSPRPPALARAFLQRADAAGSLLDELAAELDREVASMERARAASLRVAEWTGFAGNLAGIASIIVLFAMFRRVERRRRDERASFGDQFGSLRSPLEQVREGLQRLRAQGRNPKALQQTGAQLDTQISSLVERVDDIVDLRRLEEGALTLERERVDIAFVVRDAIANTAASLAARRHRPVLQLPAEPIVVFADRKRLTQLVSKLLDNASRHTPPEGAITVSAESVGARVLVRVRDNGAGMTAAQIGALFDRRGKAGAAGLDPLLPATGLRLAGALLNLHAGSLEVHSGGVGLGSEFIARLPAFVEAPVSADDSSEERGADDASIASAPLKTAASRAKRTIAGVVLRVLIVDSNAASSASTALLLRISGQEVRQATDQASAVAALVGFRPRVVVIDADAPGLAPADLVEALRDAWLAQHPERPLRIVALANEVPRSGVLGRIFRAGRAKGTGPRVDAWARKPVGQSELLAAITPR